MVDDERMRWVAAQRAAGVERRFPDFVVDRTDLTQPSFLLVGDPGEADASQYAVVEPLLARGRDTDFMVIVSDVIYPAGDVNDYVNGFYIPYEEYPKPIYALPGNHDWYAMLNGFMFHFCGAEALPPVPYHPLSYPARERRARKRWRLSSRPNRPLLLRYRDRRAPWAETPALAPQPGPYWALDAGPLRLVAIDTGVGGNIDHEQGEWLLRVSRGPRPKILLTGKPIYVNNRHDPGEIWWGDDRGLTVDDVVRDPANGYVAAVGGDVHNYQRYPVRVGDRTIQYVVSGGGGAFMNATHTIPRVDVAGVDEADFRLYPLRGDSLARYSSVLAPRLRAAALVLVVVLTVALALGLGLLEGSIWLLAFEEIPFAVAAAAAAALVYLVVIYGWIIAFGGDVDPNVAEGYVGDLLGVMPRRHEAEPPAPTPLGFLTRRKLRAVLPGPGRERRLLKGKTFSAFFDFDDPPFFKSFLRAEVRGDVLRIECYGVTGWRSDEDDPPLEDSFEIPLT
jgi:hypothetical protein